MAITQACESYFNGFREISNYRKNTCSENLLALVKLVSYVTVIIPVVIGIVYACASLICRVTYTKAPSSSIVQNIPQVPPGVLSDEPATQKKNKATKKTASEPVPENTEWLSNIELYNYILSFEKKYPALLLCRPTMYKIPNHPGNVDLVSIRREARKMGRLKDVREEVLIDIHCDNQCTTHKEMNYTEDCRSKTILAYPLNIGPEPSAKRNHWTMLIIDRAKKTVEYYDSKQNYGESKKIDDYLTNITALLNQYDRKKGEKQYTYHRQIDKVLQSDGYQCGPWVLYFLEKRLENPNFDFNTLDPDKCQDMIAAFRQKVLQASPFN
jgi:hypothetical protein